ncbi:hypothetical protein AQUCO_01000551v1 [Aquilegia coerulea]|uniref:HMA domain-containing protein n=1 Tax=Aquilegia coerulea TaxID=218851 RepID=A0A2G5EAH1_AQUCA|nr:hypothetical protein AQUCO_01000551v1 [Aquilegia coerulea]
MVQRTVLKVSITCQKCKQQLFKAVTRLEGVDKVEIDAAKGTLTVTGTADPYKIIVHTKKTKKLLEVVSIGPPPPPPPPKPNAGGGEQKKPEEPKKPAEKKPEPQPNFYMHHSCPVCEGMTYNMGYKSEPNPSCSIM